MPQASNAPSDRPTESGVVEMHSGSTIPTSASPAANTTISSQSTLASTPPRPSQELTQDEIDEKPWKYIGYRGFSAFLASDSDFCIFRRFERLNARVILALQDQISELEEALDELDRSYSRKDAPDVNNGSFRHDEQQDRVALLWEIRKKLEEYNHFVLQHIQLKTRASPTAKDIRSLRNWFYNNDGAILAEERRYIDKEDDLFALVPKDRSPLRRFFERSSHFRLLRLWQRKPPPDLPLHDRDHIHYSSDKRIEQFVTVTIISAGLCMLVAPLWILAFVHNIVAKLAVITMFTLVFLAMVSFATNAKPFEALAATAAYTAILMVFLQVGN